MKSIFSLIFATLAFSFTTTTTKPIIDGSLSGRFPNNALFRISIFDQSCNTRALKNIFITWAFFYDANCNPIQIPFSSLLTGHCFDIFPQGSASIGVDPAFLQNINQLATLAATNPAVLPATISIPIRGAFTSAGGCAFPNLSGIHFNYTSQYSYQTADLLAAMQSASAPAAPSASTLPTDYMLTSFIEITSGLLNQCFPTDQTYKFNFAFSDELTENQTSFGSLLQECQKKTRYTKR